MNRPDKFYEQMLLIRFFEEKMGALFTKGELFGTIHACIGQEAIAVGIANAMEKEDIVISNHRGHGHYIAFTDDVEGLAAELMGKVTGVCGGWGGSQHLCNGNFYSNGITGGMTAVGTGMAFAEKLMRSNRIITCFLGDGALGEGVVYESLNIASLWGLPIIFIVENNYYAMSTHVSSGMAGDMALRAKAFGIETKTLTTNDAETICDDFKKVADETRKKRRPFFFIVNTYRLCGHSKSDTCDYRSRAEEAEWRKKDPLDILQARLDDNVKDEIRGKCLKRVEEAIENGRRASFPFRRDRPLHDKQVLEQEKA